MRAALLPAFGTTTIQVASGSALEIAATSPEHGWAVASYVVARAARLGVSSVAYRGRIWKAGDNAGWRRGGGADGSAVRIS
jgi:hypothetical protein